SQPWGAARVAAHAPYRCRHKASRGGRDERDGDADPQPQPQMSGPGQSRRGYAERQPRQEDEPRERQDGHLSNARATDEHGRERREEEERKPPEGREQGEARCAWTGIGDGQRSGRHPRGAGGAKDHRQGREREASGCHSGRMLSRRSWTDVLEFFALDGDGTILYALGLPQIRRPAPSPCRGSRFRDVRARSGFGTRYVPVLYCLHSIHRQEHMKLKFLSVGSALALLVVATACTKTPAQPTSTSGSGTSSSASSTAAVGGVTMVAPAPVSPVSVAQLPNVSQPI